MLVFGYDFVLEQDLINLPDWLNRATGRRPL